MQAGGDSAGMKADRQASGASRQTEKQGSFFSQFRIFIYIIVPLQERSSRDFEGENRRTFRGGNG